MHNFSIVHTESSTGWGGQEIRILTEIQGFSSRGHRMKLICPIEAEIFRAAQQSGIEVVPLPIERKSLRGLSAMRCWLAQNLSNIDAINTHSSTDSWLTALSVATLSRKTPIIRTRHVSTAVNRSVSTQWLYRRATSHIVTTGEALRRQLHRENGYALSSMSSVPTGIDLQRFQPTSQIEARKLLGLKTDSKLIGIVATLRDWKGHSYLFEAMKLLKPKYPDWRLLVIGDGPFEASLREKVASLGLADEISFLGRQANIPEWLGALDIFALPSYGDEGVPQAILQAMACALPVVSTPVGSIAEAVQNGLSGMLVPPRDVQALADALENLINQPRERARMGAVGRERAVASFGITLMLDRMEAVFAQTLRAR